MAKLYIGNTAYKVMLGDNSGHIADLPTVVWNQLMLELNELNYTGSGIVKNFSNNECYVESDTTSNDWQLTTKSYIRIPVNHKVYASVWHKGDNIAITPFGVKEGRFMTNLHDDYRRFSKYITLSNDVANKPRMGSNNKIFTVKYWMLFDLTLMFGAGNEPTYVEHFQQWFTDNIGSLDNYYPYNPGEEIKVKYLPQNM